MVATNKAEAPLLRFTVTSSWDRIRIVLPSGETDAASLRDDETLAWHYGVPSDEVREAALNCLLDQYEHGVPGCEFVGYETESQMDVAAMECDGCGATSQPECRCGAEEGDTINNLGLSGMVA